MLIQNLIEHKKLGHALSDDMIQAWVAGVTSEQVSNEQIAAFAMAVNFQGMTVAETTALTCAMRDSGEVLDWRDAKLVGPVVDKHSTGGVADCVSLLLGPLLAAAGYCNPMIAGRGLGHTGGTIDKLESIPGYSAIREASALRRMLQSCGFFITGQGPQLAPADRRIYAVRDTTATIDIQPLIVASILSKKLAEGIQALVMDIKVGNGAFMRTQSMAESLGEAIRQTAERAGVKTAVQYHDMNQPLCPVAGNALEVAHVMQHLNGEISESRLLDETLELAIGLMSMFESSDGLEARLRRLLADGSAMAHWQQFLAHHDVPNDFCTHPARHLPAAPVQHPVCATADGVIETIHTKRLGELLILLGAGRRIGSDRLDYAAGFTDMPSLGEAVKTGDLLGTLHCARAPEAAWVEAYRDCFELSGSASN